MQQDIFVGSPLKAAPSNRSPWEQLASQPGLDSMHHSTENLKCEPSTHDPGAPHFHHSPSLLSPPLSWYCFTNIMNRDGHCHGLGRDCSQPRLLRKKKKSLAGLILLIILSPDILVNLGVSHLSSTLGKAACFLSE